MQQKAEGLPQKIAENPAFQAEYMRLEKKSIRRSANVKIDMRKPKGSYKIIATLEYDPYKYVEQSDD